jgi:iron complex outermembrane receptor protein
MTEKLQWKTTFCFHSNKSLFKSTKSGLDNIRTQSYYAQGQGGYPSTQVFKTGTAYPSFYLPKIIGYEDWGSPIYETYYNGNRKYYVMGQPAPKYELGWSNKLDIGSKVSISFSLRYAGGYKLFNATKLQLSSMYNIPRLNVNQDGVKNYALDHQTSELDESYLQNASFLRIENINLSYTIKPRNNNLFQDLVISLGTDNLYTFTGYDGYDPAGYSSGVDSFNVYPLARSYKVGFRINL